MCYNGFTIKDELFKYKRFKDGVCAYQITGSSHLKSSLTLASFKNRVRKVSLELTPVRTVTCVTLRIINEAGRVSKFVYF